jgi:RNA polymerase sigma-70 factor (ECF subfamily)
VVLLVGTSTLEGCGDMSDLALWLEEGWAPSVRTAYLILGNRLDAEDAVQEAFLRAWRFRDSLSKETSIKPWLYRVVVNTCNSKLRQEIPRRDRRESDDRLSDVAAIDDMTTRVAIGDGIVRALRDLPAHLRVVVVLRYYANLSEREIAIAIERKQGTVKSRLNEARRRLSEHPDLQPDANNHDTIEEITG